VQGDPDVIELLNEVLTAELTAINQYFIHAKMCENWGFERLAKHNYDESIDEMKDAEKVIERILYLDGVPNLQRLGSVLVGETVAEQHRLDLELERAAIERWRSRVRRATTARASCSSASSSAKRSTPTGSKRSCTSSRSSASRTTSASTSTTDLVEQPT
jgi:bacterioferritin